MKRLAILLLTITVFGFGESGVFAQFGIAPLTANQEFNTVQSHDMMSAVVTPCATCLANCVGSQAKCARECESVCTGAFELVERFSSIPQTNVLEFRSDQSYSMLSGGVTPCATCLAHCVGSQAKCARECESVCTGNHSITGDFTPIAVRSTYTTVESTPLGCCNTSRSMRHRCFLGRFRN